MIASRLWRPFSSTLTRRILAVNLLAPLALAIGLFYLDRYQEELVGAEIEALTRQAEMFAAALGEGAVVEQSLGFTRIAEAPAGQMMRRLAQPAGVRARLFMPLGDLVADTKLMPGKSGIVVVEPLAPPDSGFSLWLHKAFDLLARWQPGQSRLPLYVEHMVQKAHHFDEAAAALGGETGSALRALSGRDDDRVMVSVAVPVQRYKQIVGAIMLSTTGEKIADSLFEVRLAIVEVAGVALLLTITLSFYLAGTIAVPLRRLALAAEQVRRGGGEGTGAGKNGGRHHSIPDLTERADEIGELSGALRDMTEALWRRMDAIEAFAADVTHEIKNPLTSLRSAVETAARVSDPEKQRKLMAIVLDDVQRLDRLISDISDASRLDAELSRAQSEPVPLAAMLEALVALYRDSGTVCGSGVTLDLALPEDDHLIVEGLEGRLVQVFRNLIANALSFSPQGGRIGLKAWREGAWIMAEIEDDGPGIPDTKLAAIFERFYSERPEGEKFGTHSGLGLSISKQIIDAHRGMISAANRKDDMGRIRGARFTVRLPGA